MLLYAERGNSVLEFEELQQKGTKTTYEEVLKDMKFRDKNDSSRDFAPLKPAEDAELMDTTGNTLEQSVKQMAELVHKKMNEEKKA